MRAAESELLLKFICDMYANTMEALYKQADVMSYKRELAGHSSQAASSRGKAVNDLTEYCNLVPCRATETYTGVWAGSM